MVELKVLNASDNITELVQIHKDKLFVLLLVERGCPHCAEFHNHLEEIKAKLQDLDVFILEVSISEHPEYATNYGITGTPTFLFFVDGRASGRITGFHKPGPFISQIVEMFLGC